jgi:ketosteroid isomerase-like protein
MPERSPNVALVIAANDAYNEGDLDAVLEFYAPDVQAFPDASVFPEAGPLLGRKEFRSWIEEIDAAWKDVRWETTEVLAIGAERVLHRGDWGGEGAASGIVTRSNVTGLFTVRDGVICRVEYYFDHDKAVRAAGLSE